MQRIQEKLRVDGCGEWRLPMSKAPRQIRPNTDGSGMGMIPSFSSVEMDRPALRSLALGVAFALQPESKRIYNVVAA